MNAKQINARLSRIMGDACISKAGGVWWLLADGRTICSGDWSYVSERAERVVASMAEPAPQPTDE